MSIEWTTVAIPVTKGIDVNTRARLVEPDTLLEAENSRFHGGGAEKRRGHASRRARSTDPIPASIELPELVAPPAWEPFSTDDRHIPADWVFGWGYYFTGRTSPGVANETSTHPDAGLLFGAASRDSESLLWNGHQILSRAPAQPTGAPLVTVGDAVLPRLRSATIAKCSQAQTQPDIADTGKIRVTAWIDPVADHVNYTVQDSVTGSTIVRTTAITDPAGTPFSVRCIPVGGWVHIVWSREATTLQCTSIHEASPTSTLETSLGECDRFFDLFKKSESEWCVLRNVDGTLLSLTFHEPNGTSNSGADLVHGLTSPTFTTVGLGVSPLTGEVGVIAVADVSAARNVYWWGYSAANVLVAGPTVLDAAIPDDSPTAVAIAPKYVLLDSQAVWDVFWNVDGLTSGRILDDGSLANEVNAPTLSLASQAFRVGDRSFIWTARSTPLQNTWYLVDEKLLPVGHLDYATATVEVSAVPRSVNWAGTTPIKDVLVFHCALGYKVRVSVEQPADSGINIPAVYAEPSIRHVQMDFLCPLRSAQAGRSTYFAGAQLWTYDGDRLAEAGFLEAPEVTFTVQTGGNLTSSGQYRYRVDACYVNAQGEEVRSGSFYSDLAETTLADRQISIAINTVLTRRGADAYFLVFRNASAGTQWYLVSSRDPSSADYVANDPTAATVTFVDAGAILDADLLTQEQHPGNGGFSFIEPSSAPANELVVAGADRVWVAGGELPPGQVAPSRLFTPGETPSFNPLVAVQVDRSSEPITAIGFLGEIAFIFRNSATYLLDGNGPDNSSNGFWPPCRLAVSGVGAVSQEGIGVVPGALAFQSSAGMRALSPGGGLTPIGIPTDRIARELDISATFVSTEDAEIRWYTRNGITLVYNYLLNAWSTWSVPAAGVVINPTTRLAVVAHPEGYLWEETAGLWRDGDSPYRHRIRFAWLRANALVDYQRIRRVAGIGEAASAHSVRLSVFYDERDFAEEVMEWDYPADDTSESWNPTVMGDGDFGDGAFGDSVSPLRDAVWRWRRRLSRQKCSVVSIQIDDNYSDGAGFVLTAIALELGKKQGLDRMPWRGGSSQTAAGKTTIKNGR